MFRNLLFFQVPLDSNCRISTTPAFNTIDFQFYQQNYYLIRLLYDFQRNSLSPLFGLYYEMVYHALHNSKVLVRRFTPLDWGVQADELVSLNGTINSISMELMSSRRSQRDLASRKVSIKTVISRNQIFSLLLTI